MIDIVYDWIKRSADEVGIIAGWVAGVAALTALAWHNKSPFRRVTVWLFHRNVSEPVTGWATRTIEDVVEPAVKRATTPLAAEIMAAARAQHEAQNEAIGAIRADLARHLDGHEHGRDKQGET